MDVENPTRSSIRKKLGLINEESIENYSPKQGFKLAEIKIRKITTNFLFLQNYIIY